jgi:hypothetical protein
VFFTGKGRKKKAPTDGASAFGGSNGEGEEGESKERRRE